MTQAQIDPAALLVRDRRLDMLNRITMHIDDIANLITDNWPDDAEKDPTWALDRLREVQNVCAFTFATWRQML